MRIIEFLLVISFAWDIQAKTSHFSLRDVTTDAKKLSPKMWEQVQWLPGTSKYSFLSDQNPNCMHLRDAADSKKEDLLCLDKINLVMLESGFGKLNSFPRLEWKDAGHFLFWQKNQLLAYHLENGQVSLVNWLPSGAENVDYRIDQPERIAYTIGSKLFISESGVQVQISHGDQEDDVSYGGVVHRNEFGISKGTFWSPKARFLAFYRNDESSVYGFPNIDYEESPAVLKPFKYPMAGQANEKVTVGVYDMESKKTIYLATGFELDQYLTGITFSPDESRVYVSILNRQQTQNQLIAFEPRNGKKKELILEEKNEKYVEPELGPLFSSNRSDRFVWLSRNNGYRHLFLVDLSTGSMDQLTEGEWEVNSFDGFSDCGKKIYFHGRKESALEEHFYQLDLENKKLDRLTKEHGLHHALFNKSKNLLLDRFENASNPGQIDLLDLSNGKSTKVYSAANPLANYKLGKTDVLSLKNGNGTQLYARMIKPVDFQSDRKYPVIVYVYGGPHVQLVDDSWLNGASLWLHYMAQRGYLIFTIDNRGSYNRGLSFEQETYGQLGNVEVEDQLFGVEYLKQLPFVDSERMGVFGWSFGGFMTTSLMLKSPGVFKAGVAGGAVIDWSLYEIMYTERYMGSPESNPEGYEASNLLNFVEQLQGNLLLVHGSNDPVVVWQHSLQLAKKAASLGVDLDYYPYVGHGHGVTGDDKFHLYQKITKYFDKNLVN